MVNPIGKTTQANTAPDTKYSINLDADLCASQYVVTVTGIRTDLDMKA
jgi:hypothetical protein